MIDLVWNFPLLPGQGEEWKRYLAKAVAELDGAEAQELRPSFRGADAELRVRAAKWLGVEAERFWFSCGGHHGALMALMAADLAGKTIAAETTTYAGVIDQAKMIGARVVGLEFDGEGMTAESLRAACERETIAAIFTMPTVHNPLGCTASLERRLAIVEVAREFDLVILEDDAYGYMEPEAAASYLELAPERAFYVRGLSKNYAPATRTGMLVAPERFNGAMEGVLKSTTTGSSLPHIMACVALMEDGVIDRVMQQKREEGARRSVAARAVLGEAAAPGSKCAWHLWVSWAGERTAAEVQKICLERGVMVSGAAGFTVQGSVPARALRLALGGEVDAARTMEGVGVVAEVIRG